MTWAAWRSRAGMLVVLAAVLVGCGDGGGAEGNAGLVPSEQVERYFDAFASRRTDRLDEMLVASEPGSSAHTFALHQVAIRKAFTADGLEEPEPVPRSVVDGDIILEFGPETAKAYSDFEVDDETELLTNFSERWTRSSGPPTPISERLAAGNGTAIAAFDASFELLTVSVAEGSPDLTVTVEVRSGTEPLRLNAEPAPLVELPLPAPSVGTGGAVTSYADRSGAEHVVTAVFGLTDVPAETTTVLMLGFEGVTPGGTIFLPVGRAGELEVVAIPVPRPERRRP